VLGYTPQEVDGMSLWQFQAAVNGYIEANSPPDDDLTAEEGDALWEFING